MYPISLVSIWIGCFEVGQLCYEILVESYLALCDISTDMTVGAAKKSPVLVLCHF